MSWGVNTIFGPGALPIAWTDIDLSAITGVKDVLCFSSQEWLAAAFTRYALRVDGDTAEYAPAWAVDMALGTATVGNLAVALKQRGMLSLARQGIIEHKSAIAQNGQLDLIGWLNAHIMPAPDGYKIVSTAIPPVAWGTAIDLTTDFLGADTGLVGENLAVLRFWKGAGGAAKHNITVRRNGDIYDYYHGGTTFPLGSQVGCCFNIGDSVILIVSTDATGLIEWRGNGGAWEVFLLGYLNFPPILTGIDPAPGTVETTADANVEFTATDDVAVIQTTIDLTLTPPVGPVQNAIVNGVFDVANGFSGLLWPDGAGNFAPILSRHPDWMPGLWQADIYGEDIHGESDTDTWTWTVGGMALVDIVQSSTNSVDVTFDEEPLHLDASNPQDGLYLAAYAVTGPVSPLKERLIWGAEYIGDNTIRLYFDGDLVRDETYTITITGLKSAAGYLLIVPATGSFIAYGVSILPVSLLREIEDSYDLHNPQTASEAGQRESLGTLSADESGDLSVENRRSSLKKRVIRRCTTKPGGFAHLKDYGLRIDSKSLLRPSDLRKLQIDAEDQVGQEPDVRSVRATVSQILPGVIQLSLRVVDRYGPIEIQTLLGD